MNKKKLVSILSAIVIALGISSNVHAATALEFTSGTNFYDELCQQSNNASSCSYYNKYRANILNYKLSAIVAEYINEYQGKYVGKHGELGNKVSWSAPYQGQCASLVKYYLSLYGYQYDDNSYGDAKDYTSLKNSTIVTDPQDGDLVIWKGGKYGHIGIYYQGKVFNQNPKAASLDEISDYDALGQPTFVRPNYQMY